MRAKLHFASKIRLISRMPVAIIANRTARKGARTGRHKSKHYAPYSSTLFHLHTHNHTRARLGRDAMLLCRCTHQWNGTGHGPFGLMGGDFWGQTVSGAGRPVRRRPNRFLIVCSIFHPLRIYCPDATFSCRAASDGSCWQKGLCARMAIRMVCVCV